MGYTIGSVIALILIIIGFIDVLNSGKDTGTKVLWCLLIFFLPLIGLILWFVIGKK